MTTTPTIPIEITEFATRVRAALADLPPDEVDDLTDGLEADLAEAYAEDLARELPDPQAYATELRTAAGLPLRSAERQGVRGAVEGLWTGLRDTARDVERSLRRNAVTAGILDFLASLRPAWWILRALIAYTLVFGFMLGMGLPRPWDLGSLLLIGAMCVVSVQWGRGRWRFRGLGPVIVAGNVVAAVVAVPLFYAALEDVGYWRDYAYEEPMYYESDLTGVYLNGAQVTNIFAYGPDGEPLADVQLFDEHGNPLTTSVPGGNGCLDAECEEEGVWLPAVLETGAAAWNVFPMMMAAGQWNDWGEMEPQPGATPERRTPPFVKVPAVQQADETAKDGDEVVAENND